VIADAVPTTLVLFHHPVFGSSHLFDLTFACAAEDQFAAGALRAYRPAPGTSNRRASLPLIDDHHTALDHYSGL
jgi:hypothetical protein